MTNYKERKYQETNEKFVQRMQHMLYEICGCDAERGKLILDECLERNKIKQIALIMAESTNLKKEKVDK